MLQLDGIRLQMLGWVIKYFIEIKGERSSLMRDSLGTAS